MIFFGTKNELYKRTVYRIGVSLARKIFCKKFWLDLVCSCATPYAQTKKEQTKCCRKGTGMAAQLPIEFDVVRKQLFVENLTLGVSPVDAARAAGFTADLKKVANKLLEDEEVKDSIESYKRHLTHHYDVSRERVLRDLVDAKEIARVQADPKGMVMALKEVSEVMGHHAPKQMAVEQNVNINASNVRHKMRQISDAQLLEMAEEGEFVAVELLPHDD